MKKKPTYIKCPRCELNYIKSEDKYCPVCLAELKLAGEPFDNMDEDLEICPSCGQNFISPDQKMCEDCAKQKGIDLEYDDEGVMRSDESEEASNWDDDLVDGDEDVELIPLSAMEEDEEDDDESEEEDSDRMGEFDDDFESLDDDDYDDDDYDDDEEDEDDDDEDEDY